MLGEARRLLGLPERVLASAARSEHPMGACERHRETARGFLHTHAVAGLIGQKQQNSDSDLFSKISLKAPSAKCVFLFRMH